MPLTKKTKPYTRPVRLKSQGQTSPHCGEICSVISSEKWKSRYKHAELMERDGNVS